MGNALAYLHWHGAWASLRLCLWFRLHVRRKECVSQRACNTHTHRTWPGFSSHRGAACEHVFWKERTREWGERIRMAPVCVDSRRVISPLWLPASVRALWLWLSKINNVHAHWNGMHSCLTWGWNWHGMAWFVLWVSSLRGEAAQVRQQQQHAGNITPLRSPALSHYGQTAGKCQTMENFGSSWLVFWGEVLFSKHILTEHGKRRGLYTYTGGWRWTCLRLRLRRVLLRCACEQVRNGGVV